MLQVLCLEIRYEVLSRVAMDEQSGSQWRGSLIGALWERFCVNKASDVCSSCMFYSSCAVAALVAPDAAPNGRVHEPPRAYVTRPPAGGIYEAGSVIIGGITLFGDATRLVPYIVIAATDSEVVGLGNRQAIHGGRRGSVRCQSVSAVHPWSGRQEFVYEHGRQGVKEPQIYIGANDVAAFASELPTDMLTLHFQTPLRLTQSGQVVWRFDLEAFLRRMTERIHILGECYGIGSPLETKEYNRDIRVLHDSTRWVDVASHSARSHRASPIGGLVGSVTLGGELTTWREALVWASLVHVGKNAVKGSGAFQVTGRMI